MNRQKIFLSSTFIDLKEYRESIMDLVNMFQDQYEFMGLEFYAGSEVSVAEKSLENVNRCDIFILLVGNRYGYILPNSHDQKSIVQIETEAAITQKKPMLVFFLESADTMEPEFHEKKLDAFKKFLADRFLIRYVKTKEELKTGLVEALYILKSGLEKRKKITEEKFIEDNRSETKAAGLNIIRILLSSPSDVGEERERVAKAVCRFNNEFVEEKGVFIKVIRWEDMAPQIDRSPQFTINNQIGKYDIFIGVMWNRFGTPTDVASSGTEEEFDTALASYTSNNKKPWISFYFSHRAKALVTEEQLDQKRKVIEFNNKLKTMGIITEYKSLEKFETTIFEDIKKIIKAAKLHEL